MSSEKIKKILIIDDSPFTRKVLKEMIESEKDLKVIATATNGLEGLKKTIQLKPDLITLDLEMPEMDGFSFLRFLMSEQPTPVIVVSSLTSSNNVFKALELGAIDFVAKPTPQASLKLLDIKKDLLFKIRAALLSSYSKKGREFQREPINFDKKKELIFFAIGASTGGPQALQKILSELPPIPHVAMFIAQHMPEGFTKVFAERLNKLSNLNVKEGKDGDLVNGGEVYISPGGHHMTVIKENSEIYIEVRKKGENDIYVPSVNHLFASLIPLADKTTAIVLTGMGSDGKNGAKALKEAGAEIWAESADSAIIYGMPKEIVNANLADRVMPLWDFPKAIVQKCGLYD